MLGSGKKKISGVAKKEFEDAGLLPKSTIKKPEKSKTVVLPSNTPIPINTSIEAFIPWINTAFNRDPKKAQNIIGRMIGGPSGERGGEERLNRELLKLLNRTRIYLHNTNIKNSNVKSQLNSNSNNNIYNVSTFNFTPELKKHYYRLLTLIQYPKNAMANKIKFAYVSSFYHDYVENILGNNNMNHDKIKFKKYNVDWNLIKPALKNMTQNDKQNVQQNQMMGDLYDLIKNLKVTNKNISIEDLLEQLKM
jgi:hypothetical protein